MRMFLAHGGRALKRSLSSSGSFLVRYGSGNNEQTPINKTSHDKSHPFIDPIFLYEVFQDLILQSQKSMKTNMQNKNTKQQQQKPPETLPIHKIYLSFLTLLHIIKDMNIRDPLFREEFFQQSNDENNMTPFVHQSASSSSSSSSDDIMIHEEEVDQILQYFNLIGWANDEFSTDEKSDHHHLIIDFQPNYVR